MASELVEGTEARWSLRLFGGFELRKLPCGEKVTVPGRRERVLLAYLALSPDCRQPRRKLAMLLWGDGGPDTALDNLRTCIFNLRKALDDTEHRLIASDGRDVVLDAAAFEIDALVFRELTAQSGVTELEAAAERYAGGFLDGFGIDSEEFESWRREEATRCKDSALDVLTRLMELLAKSGETERAIEVGVRILRLEPLHEAAARHLMRLYGESGRRGAAKEVYRRLAEALRTELNAQPEAETRTIFGEIVGDVGESPAADDKLPPQTKAIARAGLSPGPLRNTNAAEAKLAPLGARLGRLRKPPSKPLLTAFRAHSRPRLFPLGRLRYLALMKRSSRCGLFRPRKQRLSP
jgi:DNA-binding SARP family transcriptional activator